MKIILLAAASALACAAPVAPAMAQMNMPGMTMKMPEEKKLAAKKAAPAKKKAAPKGLCRSRCKA